jgi:hypothetical protein
MAMPKLKMESEFNGHVRRAMERLLQQMEGLERRQEALEALTQRIMAEQEELRREQAELRRRQEAQSQKWQDFGRRWSAYSAAWKAQVQQLKGFTRQLTALLPRCRRRNEVGEGGRTIRAAGGGAPGGAQGGRTQAEEDYFCAWSCFSARVLADSARWVFCFPAGIWVSPPPLFLSP